MGTWEGERRRDIRLSTTGGSYQVSFRFRERHVPNARLANVSAGGCGLEIQMAEARDMDAGSVLEDFFLLHPDLPCVPMRATVVRLLGKVAGKTSGYVLAGVEFTMITPFVKQLIQDHVVARMGAGGALPERNGAAVPSGSIDQLRAFLDHLDGDQRAQQLAFFQAILEYGPAAIEELDDRLPGSRAPRALRRLAMEASFYFPWPGWAPIHRRLLRYEAIHEIFLTGVRSLGRMGTGGEALEVLRELGAVRQGEQFTGTLAEVLSQTDPLEAFNHYFGRLLQGSANAGVANDAAQHLLQLVDGASIEAIKTLTQHPDLLVFRHAMVLLAHIFTADAAEALKAILLENHREVLGDRRLKTALAAFGTLPPAAAAQAAGAALAELASNSDGDPEGLLDEFYRAVLAAALEGKPGQLGSLLQQTADGLHQRSRRLGFALDAAAEGLADMAARGLIAEPVVLELLVQAFRLQTGREGLARALARLVPDQAEDIHQLILEAPDAALRAAAVELLGLRAEPALQPVLLRACQDPLADIADRARFFLGKLPGAQALAASLLRGPEAEFQLGLRLAAEHRFHRLVPDLLERLRTATREDQVLRLVGALGAMGAEPAIEPLLEMLHSGQSLRLQGAIAQSLRDMSLPQAARALCAKADQFKAPELHAIAVEALLTAGAAPDEVWPMLLDQVRRAWNGRNPWPMRLRLARTLQAATLVAPELWQHLASLVNEALGEPRPPGAWSAEELHQAQAAAREFARRAC